MAGLTIALSGGCGSASKTGAASTAGTQAPHAPAASSVLGQSASPSSPASGSATKANPLTGACHADQLTTQWTDSDKTGGGHRYATILVSNKSTTACWLSGQLGMTIIDADQNPVNTPVHFPATTVRVELKPGGSAAAGATLSSDRNPPPGQSACSPVMAVFRIVIPEANYSPVVSGWHIPRCPADVITISGLVAGTTAPPA